MHYLYQRIGYNFLVMNIHIIDIYPDNGNKSCKDTGGGYGTSHDYGQSLFSAFIRLFVRRNVSFPPLYIPYLMRTLKEQGHNVKISLDYKESDNTDIYIVISSIIAHELELGVIKDIRKKSDQIIVCGAFARFNSKPYLEAGAKLLDAEPEFYFQSNKIEDFFNQSKSVETQVKKYHHDFKLPLPDWKELLGLYKCKLGFLSFKQVVPIAFTKGCPFSCATYCTYPLEQGAKVRTRDIDELISEIKFIQKEFGISNFLFRDPVFTINKKNVQELAKELIDLDKKISFAIETHLNLLDEELVKVLAQVGLKLAYVGVESNSQEVCEKEGRYTSSFEKQLKMIRLLEKYKVDVKIMYIIGFPSEKKENFLANKKLAKVINSLYVQLNIFTPYPGTLIFESLKNKITSDKYLHFNQSNLVFDHKEYSPEQARGMISNFYIDYYFRWRWFYKFINAAIKRILS